MAVEVAENRQRAARAQLSVTQARVSQAEATVAQSEAAVERSEEELSNATIRSPIKGMVLSRDVEIGRTLTVPEKAVIYDAQRNASVEAPAPGTRSGKEKKAVKVA